MATNRSNRRLWWFAATLGALLLAALMPASAAAAARITFGQSDSLGLSIGDSCVSGRAAADSIVKVVWKSASGDVKARASVNSNILGDWRHCSDGSHVLAVGDRIKAADDIGSRTITMPRVTLVGDRVNNLFRGRAPAGSMGRIWWHSGIFADYYEFEDVAARSDGTWRFRPYSDFDLIGGIYAFVDWRSAKGDYFSAGGMAPYVEVVLGRSTFSGQNRPGRESNVALRDPDTGARIARGTAVADTHGAFAGRLRDDQGDPIAVMPGDRLISTIASDANWLVPNIDGAANAGNDHVSGICHGPGLTETAVARVYRTGRQRGYAFLQLDGAGAFEIDFSGRETLGFDPANIKLGDRVTIACLHETGDWVVLEFRVT